MASRMSPATQLDRNFRSLQRQLRGLKTYGFGELAAIMAQRSATFAAYRHAGIFASKELESFISEISARNVRPNPCGRTIEEGSTLHLLSRALEAGGHTRVVERWIGASPKSEKHSILITRGGVATEKLKAEVAAHDGEIVIQRKFSSLLGRAKEILEISRAYSRVVLHVHMDDILPMLAFTGGGHSAQIIHFNHADHRFWVGASLPNRVIEMRSWGKAVSETKRGILNSEVVGIPLPDIGHNNQLDKSRAREALGIPLNKKVLLTVGHSRKYLANTQPFFSDAVRELLSGHPERHLFAVGPEKKLDKNWRSLSSDFPDQVTVLSYMPKQKLDLYFKAADLGLDSFPMSGGTAVLDMLSSGLPTLSLKCATGHFDVIYNSIFYCETIQDWVAKANKLLNERNQNSKDAINEVLFQAGTAYGPQVWAQVLSSEQEAQLPERPVQIPDFEELNNYLIASTPKLARLFF